MNAASWIALGALAVAVAIAVWRGVRKKTFGGCGGDCASCRGCASAEKERNP